MSITGLGIRKKITGGVSGGGSKDGTSKESSWHAGDLKGRGMNRINGLMGKGKDSEPNDHVAMPVSSLKDPAAFGPPPKNVNYHGGAALPNQITPDRRGWGAPLSREEIQARQQAEEEEAQREAEEAARPKPPPMPYRADTTGLSTSHLPPPPGRKDGADGRSPPPPPVNKPKPPSLPPRLPPRQNSSPAPSPPPTYNAAASEPDSHRGILNQGSLNRLGAAGLSVQGFGIGEKKGREPVPPPKASSSRNTSRDPPQVNTSQLNELQSRFSRQSPSSPKPESQSEGTSFAQKQAALKTASSFRNDPSSVSLSDAKSAASTANNFRERHGEQVKSGWQSANKLNTKYGISDKVGAYGGGGNSQQEVASPQERANSNGLPQVAGLKKKPPPPPAKKAQLTSPNTGKEPLPPPIPLSSKPKPQSASSYSTGELDLALKTLWFAETPPHFPPPSLGRNGEISHASSSGWSSNGVRKTHTFNAVIQDNSTMARTKILLTWDASNPGLTVNVQERHFPPPRKLSRHKLDDCREKYSEALASWCESNMGQQVGDGECWTLAHNGLQAIAAKCSARGQEPCMTSQSLVHGHRLYSFMPATSPHPDPRGGVLEAGVSRGNIIQLLTSHFHAKDGSQKWAGAPDHTAVVVGVNSNGQLNVVEQNVGNVKRVQLGSYNMSELIKGEVRIFRAVGINWVGKLDPSW
ncbi:Altered inheritance of mitochondria protein [Lachnellula occidentalis]|uniref:Altered inheritance of mitochondria protein n=1 Tax=Lachnellula occidentalis TaxID=215460 RepID=A0A8H8S055_9HELO|nr:Altered inheritance of mitochondria protein [Lachnellula occidentalis]